MGAGTPSAELTVHLPKTLTQHTLEQLIGWLKEGTFKPGSKLPSQSELVRHLGISRTGIREALQVMSALNLIEIRPGLGCFVKRVSPEYIVNADVLAILLEKEAILEVIEARKILEAGIAALAAARASEQDFWLLEDVLNRVEKAIERDESVADLTPEFHIGVARATHNTVLAKLVKSFNRLMAKAGELVESSVEDLAAFRRHELQSHRQLYEVIRQGDPHKASAAIIKHIEASKSMILKAFGQAEGLEETKQ